MFSLWKTFRFEASHQLVDHDGKCKRLHGHSWVFRLFVEGPYLKDAGPKRNMVVDFGLISRRGKEIVELLDHQHLNDLKILGDANGHVTSEWLAQWIFDYVREAASDHLDFNLVAVEVEETCTSGCRYSL